MKHVQTNSACQIFHCCAIPASTWIVLRQILASCLTGRKTGTEFPDSHEWYSESNRQALSGIEQDQKRQKTDWESIV